MPFPPPTLPTNFVNDTAQTDEHPINHNLIGQAVNDTVAQIIADKQALLDEIAANTAGINGNSANISSLEGDVNSNASSISTLQSTVSNQTSSINANSSAINNLQQDVDTGLRRHGGGWVNIGTINSWTPHAGRQPAQYRKRGDLVDVRFDLSGGSWNGSTYTSNWFTFPSGFRPPYAISIGISSATIYNAVGSPRLYIQTNGVSTFYGISSNANINGFISFAVT